MSRLNREDAAMLLIDHQVGLLSLVRDFTPAEFKNNVMAVADTRSLPGPYSMFRPLVTTGSP